MAADTQPGSDAPHLYSVEVAPPIEAQSSTRTAACNTTICPNCLVASGTMTPCQFAQAAQLLATTWQHLPATCSHSQSPSPAMIPSASQHLSQTPHDAHTASADSAPCTLGHTMRQGQWVVERQSPVFGEGQVQPLLVMRDVPHSLVAHHQQAGLYHQPAGDDSASLTDEEQTHVHSAPAVQPHLYTLSVVLHPVYQVPTLYIKARKTDGSALSWQDMELDFPHWEQLRSQLGDASWALLAPADDQVLKQSGGLMLHPCQTASVMQLLLSASAEDHRNDGKQTVLHAQLAATQCGSDSSPAAPAEDRLQWLDREDTCCCEVARSHDPALELRYLVGWLCAVVGPVLNLRLSPLDVYHICHKH